MAILCLILIGLSAYAIDVSILRSYQGFQVPDDEEIVISLADKVSTDQWSTVSFTFFMYVANEVNTQEKIMKVRNREDIELGAIYRSGSEVEIRWKTDLAARDECDSDATELILPLEITKHEWNFIGFTINPDDKLVQGFCGTKSSLYPFQSKVTLEISPLLKPTISADHTLTFVPISAKNTILTSFNMHNYGLCVDNFMGLTYLEHLGILTATKEYPFTMIEKYFFSNHLTTLQADLGDLIPEGGDVVYVLYKPDLPTENIAVSFDYSHESTDFYSFDLYLDVLAVENVEYAEVNRVLTYHEDTDLKNYLSRDNSVYCGNGIVDYTLDGFTFKYVAQNENKLHKISIFEYSNTFSSIQKKFGIDPPNNLAQTLLDYSYQLPVYTYLSSSQKLATTFSIIDCRGCNANANTNNIVDITNSGLLSIRSPLGDLSFTIKMIVNGYSYLSKNTLEIAAEINPPTIAQYSSVFTGINELLVFEIDYSDNTYGNTWWYAHTLVISTSKNVPLESLGLYVSNTPEYDRKLVWIPTTSMRFTLDVTMKNAGGKSITYSEKVYANTLPVLNSIPSFNTYNQCKFKYQIQASDADSDTIFYAYSTSKTLIDSELVGSIIKLTTEGEDLLITVNIWDESEDYVAGTLVRKIITTQFELKYADIPPVMTYSKQYCYKHSICVTHFLDKVTVHNSATAQFSLKDPAEITNIGHFGYFTASAASTIHTTLNIIEENYCYFCNAFTLLIGDELEIDPIPTIFYRSDSPLKITPIISLDGNRITRVESAYIVDTPKVILFEADDLILYWKVPDKTNNPGIVKVLLTNSVPVALGSFYFYIIMDTPRTVSEVLNTQQMVVEYGQEWTADISKLISGEMNADKQLLYYEVIGAGKIIDLAGKLKWTPDTSDVRISLTVNIIDPRHYIDSYQAALTSNSAISWINSYPFSLDVSFTAVFSLIDPSLLIRWRSESTTVNISYTHYERCDVSVVSNPKSLTMVNNNLGTLTFTWSSPVATTSGRIVISASDKLRSSFSSSTEFEIYVKSDIAPSFENELNDVDSVCRVGQAWRGNMSKYIHYYPYVYGTTRFEIVSSVPDISSSLSLTGYRVLWTSPATATEQQITFKACNYVDCTTHTYTLTCLYPISISNIPVQTANQGAHFSVIITVYMNSSLVPLSSLSELWISNAPENMSINKSTGEISWDLQDDEAIRDISITVHAMLPSLVSSSKSFLLSILSNATPTLSLKVPSAPQMECLIINPPNNNCVIDIHRAFDTADIDTGETFTYRLTSDPSLPSIYSISGDQIIWNRKDVTEPSASSSVLTVVAIDSKGADSMSVSFMIYPNYAPSISNLSGDVEYTVLNAYKGCEWIRYFNIYDELKTYPTQPSYFIEQNIVITISHGQTITRNQGTLIWTPSQSLTADAVSIKISYTDGGVPNYTVNKEFSVNIVSNNLPGCTVPSSARQIFEDTGTWTLDLSSYCSDSNGDELEYSIQEGPARMSLTGSTLRWNTSLDDLGSLYSIIIRIREKTKNSISYYEFSLGVQSKLCMTVTYLTAVANIPFYSYLSVCSSPTLSLDNLKFRMISTTPITIDSHGDIYWANPIPPDQTITIEIQENHPNYPPQTMNKEITYTVNTSRIKPIFNNVPISKDLYVDKEVDFEYSVLCLNSISSISIDMSISSDLSSTVTNNNSGNVIGKYSWPQPHAQSSELNIVRCENSNGMYGVYGLIFTPDLTQKISPVASSLTLSLTQDSSTNQQIVITDSDTYLQETTISLADGEDITQFPGLNLFKWGYIDWTPTDKPTVYTTDLDGKIVGNLNLKITSAGVVVPFSVGYSLSMVNHAPQFNYVVPVHFDSKTSSFSSFVIRASDIDGDTMSFTIDSSPDSSFTISDGSTIKWSPDSKTSLSQVTFKVTDSSGLFSTIETIGCQGVSCRFTPIITSISSTLGCTNNGNTVQNCEVYSPKDLVEISIKGHNFGTELPEVYVGRRQCTVQSHDSKNIVCQLPLISSTTLNAFVYVVRKNPELIGYVFESISYKGQVNPVLKDSEFFGRSSIVTQNESGDYDIPISAENMINKYSCSVLGYDDDVEITANFVYESSVKSVCRVSSLTNSMKYYLKICIGLLCSSGKSYTFIARNDIYLQIDNANSSIPSISSGHSHGGYYLPIKILNLSSDDCNTNRIYLSMLGYSISVRNICANRSGAILIPSTTADTSNVLIRISINGGLTYSTDANSIVFIYTGYCDLGQYVTNNQCIDCSPGTYCDHTFTRNSIILAPRPCSMGYYQDQTKSTACKPCPLGKQCYCTQMTNSAICDAGFICDSEGTIKRYKPCESGYYCKEGTIAETKNRLNINGIVSNVLPIPCPEDTYCIDGIYTAVSNINDKYTPSTCTDPVKCPLATENYIALPNCEIGYFCPNSKTCLSGSAWMSNCSCSSDKCECPKGYYCPNGYLDVPIKCPTGYYQDTTHQTECKECPKGYYCPTTDTTTKIACSLGYECPVKSISPNPCNKGFYRSADNADCVMCDIGRVCPDIAMVTPNNCPSGKMCAESGLKYGVNCPAGYFCYENTNKQPFSPAENTPDYIVGNVDVYPEPCPKGKYCPGNDKQGIPCDVDTYSDSIGSAVCIECPNGKLCTPQDSAPTVCPAGSYCIGNRAYNCPEGHYCSEGSVSGTPTADSNDITAELCDPGTYCIAGTGYKTPNSSQPKAALKCVVGTYNDQYGQSTCKPCISGYECSVEGTINPSPCAAGKYSSAGATNCALCPAGSYSDSTGKSVCTSCPGGKICATEGMSSLLSATICPAGYYCPAGSSAGIICPAGFYCTDETENYLTNSCPAGRLCNAGTTATNDKVTICNNDADWSYCSIGLACPIGYYCKAGTTSPKACDKGYYCKLFDITNLNQYIACESTNYCRVICPKNEYCPTASSLPTACLSGYLSSAGSDAEEDCVICPKNKYCTADADEPTACLSGYLSSPGSDAQEDCVICPANKYCTADADDPLDCPVNTISVAGSSSINDCSDASRLRRIQENTSEVSYSHYTYKKPLSNTSILSIQMHPYTYTSLISHIPISLLTSPQNLILSYSSPTNLTHHFTISTDLLQIDSNAHKTEIKLLSHYAGNFTVRAEDDSYFYLLKYIEVQSIEEYYRGFLTIIPSQSRKYFEVPANIKTGILQISTSNELPDFSKEESDSYDMIQDYLPYIGYCRPELSRFISLNHLLYSEECEFNHTNNEFVKSELICSKNYQCKFGENITSTNDRKLYWYEALTENTNYRYKNMQKQSPFYISKHSLDRQYYLNSLEQHKLDDEMIPVTVKRDYNEVSWQEGYVPQTVKLILGSSFTSGNLHILKASMELSNFYIPNNTYRQDYSFEFTLENLSWLERFNSLSLEIDEYYMTYFMIISLLFIIQCISFAASLLYKPITTKPEFLTCYMNQFVELTKAIVLTFVSCGGVVCALYLIFKSDMFEGSSGDFNDEVQVSEADTQDNIDRKLGRAAVCLMTACFCGLKWCCDLMYLETDQISGNKQEKKTDSKGSCKYFMILCVGYLVALDNIGCYDAMKYIVSLSVILIEASNYLLSSWFERHIQGLLKLTVLRYILDCGSYIMLLNISELSTVLQGLITITLIRLLKENILSNLNCSSSAFYVLATGPFRSNLDALHTSTFNEITNRMMPMTILTVVCTYLVSMCIGSSYMSIHLNYSVYSYVLVFVGLSLIIEPAMLLLSFWIKQSRDSRFDVQRVYNKCWEDFKNRNSLWGVKNKNGIDEEVPERVKDTYSMGFSYQWYLVILLGCSSAIGMVISIRMYFIANYSPFLDYSWVGLVAMSNIYIGYFICQIVKFVFMMIEKRSLNKKVGYVKNDIKNTIVNVESSLPHIKEYDVKLAYDKGKLDTRERSESPLSNRLALSILDRVRSSHPSRSIQYEIADCISQHLAPKAPELKSIFKMLKQKFPTSPTLSPARRLAFNNLPENQVLRTQATNIRRKQCVGAFPPELRFSWNI